MKLYKFRSFDQLEYILDIAFNERLYCAEYHKLNDPFEGMFHEILPIPPWLQYGRVGAGVAQRPMVPSRVDRLHVGLSQTRICSLSSTPASSQLWSLYAGGHTGVAIEIDFSGYERELHKVEYKERLPELYNTLLGSGGYEQILRTKTKQWEYEAEYRLIEAEEWCPVPGRICRVIAGYRVSESRLRLLRQVLPAGIPLVRAQLDYEQASVRA